MRGIAALAVVQFHSHYLFSGARAASAYLAVDLFFMLSGFVLAHAYQERLRSRLSFWEFVRIRLVRLYPLYLLALGFSASYQALNLVIMHPSFTFTQLVATVAAALLFLPIPPGLSTIPGELFPLNIPAWSLFFELLANVIFVVVSRRRGAGKGLAIAAGVLLVLGILFSGSADIGSSWATFLAGLPRVIFSFFAGVWLFSVRLPQSATPSTAVAAILGCLCLMLTLSPSSALRPWYDMAIVFIAFPLMIMTAATMRPAQFNGLLAFLGAISYGVYVLHLPIIVATGGLADKILKLSLADVGFWTGVAIMVMTIMAAWIADRFYDRPVRAALSGKANRGPARAT